MKICVCGKGGSGKSTIVALPADAFRRKGNRVVVPDSDESNSSLYWMLGLDKPPHALMDMVVGVVEPSLESVTLTLKVMELTKSSGAVFKGAILNKVLSTEQKSILTDKLDALKIPIVETIEFNTEFQSACLDGKALDASMVSEKMDIIIDSLTNHVIQTA